MTELSAGMDAELAKPAFTMFGAVEIELPDGTPRLLDGSGYVWMNGEAFTGRDATFGVLGGITDYTDGVDGEAPSLTLTMLPPSNAAMASIAAPAAQGSPVRFWTATLDRQSGEVIDDPVLCFVGMTDVPTQEVDMNTRSLDVTVVSVFDQFFDDDEWIRLNPGFQGSVWPGEVGLEYVPQVRDQMPWGMDAAAPAVSQVPATALNQVFGRV